MKIYNTLSRTRETFEPIEPGKVRMYVCGVTVYDDSHIGHALMAVVFDVIRRYLEWSGYSVTHAQNFTDVDDKIIVRAAERGVDPIALAEEYIEAWHRESEALNLLPATVYPRASEEIPHIIEMIEGLIEHGAAYVAASGDVNYSVSSFEEYGKLSHQRLEDLLAGARIGVDETKEHPMDFVLWKAAKPGEIAWESPWGPGRPGWHIECSVMARRHLGDRIDIHGGGADLIFPHHENEIAQSETFEECRPFAKYWVHNALLEFHGDKMSKSVGNLIKTQEIIDNGDVGPFRLMVMQTHYRHPLTFREEGLEAARRGYERLANAARGFNEADVNGSSEEMHSRLKNARDDFKRAMDDDFNTPVAVSVLFDVARLANQAEGPDRAKAQQTLLELGGVLGLPLDAAEEPERATDAAPFIDLLLEVRAELRADRQFDAADKIRDRLTSLGVIVEDSPDGATWRIAR
ncbi:MAG: cysteine--tRNA ligase [Chloroflexota bacterium]